MKLSLDHTVVQCGNRAGTALLAELHAAAFSPQDERTWQPSEFAALLETPGTSATLYSAEGKPAGFTLVRTILDEAELISIAVAPTYQGKGYAKAMMDDTIQQLKALGVRRFYLEVREDNQQALALYRTTNFKKIGERKDYYKQLSGKKLNAQVFSLNLD